MTPFDSLLSRAGISRPKGYDFYFKNYIYKDIDLNEKKLLDIGGGNGIASFHALHSFPTCSAWVVDPIAEGSNELMLEHFSAMESFYDENRINYHRDYVDSLQEPKLFDAIIMHNTINHIGEDILNDISDNEGAYSEYVKRLETITSRLSPGGVMIVADCGRQNFFGWLGLNSPFAPSIDWNLHCEPGVWQGMIEDIGFTHIRTQWTARREFSTVGKIFFANRLFSFFTNSHFVSFYRKL